MRYPGGKSRQSIREQILNHASEFLEYREPFCGGSGLFFGLPTHKTRWINDINPHLIEVYKALKDRPKEFIDLCQSIPPAKLCEETVTSAGGTEYNKRLYDLFYELRDNKNVSDPALRYFFLNRTGFAGRVILDGDRKDRTTFSNPDGWNIVATKKLPKAAAILKDARITCGDYEPLFYEPGSMVWIYADPPYCRDTELNDSSKLYQYGFSWEDHRNLAQVVHNTPHYVCVSYDDHPFIRDLYNGLYIHEVSWTYCGTTSDKKNIGKEILITNYPLTEAGDMFA